MAPAAIAALWIVGCAQAWGGEAKESDDEFETKHIFGFTEGVDVGTAGDKEAETETGVAIGKRGGGRYGAVEQEFGLEFVPNSRFSYELTLHGVSTVMANVPGLTDPNQTGFSGFSIMPKFILLQRGVDAPFGLAVSASPAWDRIDPVTGGHARDFGLQAKIHLDAELIERKLYIGSNLVYSPEIQNEVGAGISHTALMGATGALAWRIAPNVGIGGEAEFYRAEESLAFRAPVGSAVYLGPTLEVQISPKAFLAAAWSTQVGGKTASGSPETLALYNQSEFSRQRATLIFEYQY